MLGDWAWPELPQTGASWGARGSGYVKRLQKFKAMLSSPSPAKRGLFLEAVRDVCVWFRFWPNINFELGNLFVIIIWITPLTNQMFVCLRRPMSRPQRGMTTPHGGAGTLPASRLLPTAASFCWENAGSNCSTVSGLLQPGSLLVVTRAIPQPPTRDIGYSH